MSEWKLVFMLRIVPGDNSRGLFLKMVSGRSETPTLVDSTRDVILIGEEQTIIRYVRKYYRKRNPQKGTG
jgi:hypothetical protein